MQRLLLASFAVLLLAMCTTAEEINNIPECAKGCALEYISSHPDCPLVTQRCICAYLAYYNTCVKASCNGTDAAGAFESPVPYYIPDATISIEMLTGTGTMTMCPLSMSLNTPTFVPASATLTTKGPSSSSTESPAKTETRPTTSTEGGEDTAEETATNTISNLTTSRSSSTMMTDTASASASTTSTRARANGPPSATSSAAVSIATSSGAAASLHTGSPRSWFSNLHCGAGGVVVLASFVCVMSTIVFP